MTDFRAPRPRFRPKAFPELSRRIAQMVPLRRYPRILLVIATGIGLFAAGYLAGSTRPAPPAHAQTGAPEDVESLFAPFWEAWGLLHGSYVDQPLDDTLLMQGALRGMVDALGDQHTAYMTPEEYALLNGDLSGQFEGIGAEVEQNADGDFVIIAPLDDSPAQAAGLLSDDEIVAVDGVDVRDLTESEIIGKVRGPAGSPVVLTIRREGTPGSFDVLVVRAVITIEDVEWQMVDGDIAYVRLAQFGTTTDTTLHERLNEVMALQPRGLILDLRGNPGGLLDVAIDVTSEFIGSGPLMIERGSNERDRVYKANGDGLATDIPLVVLVDNGSASASEVLAAAVQTSGRGSVVGETTFGKGSVQNWHELDDGSGLRITVARWFAPDGTWVHETGVQPDMVVEWAGPRAPNLEQDVQVNAAIDVLHGQTLWPTWPLPWLDTVPAGVTG